MYIQSTGQINDHLYTKVAKIHHFDYRCQFPRMGSFIFPIGIACMDQEAMAIVKPFIGRETRDSGEKHFWEATGGTRAHSLSHLSCYYHRLSMLLFNTSP